MKHANRAKRIIEARAASPEVAADVERAVALELLAEETFGRDGIVRAATFPQYGYLSPMAATEVFARELQRGLEKFALGISAKAPKAGKYHPLVATPTLFREVWRARQVLDELGIPYGFYVDRALLRWWELGNKRMPRPSQLTRPEIAVHVIQCWADPAHRWAYPLFERWDERFDAERYEGDAIQDRALDLIDQRVADAKALGRDPAEALLCLLDAYISEDEARRRLGDALVDDALKLEALAIAEDIELHGLGPAIEILEANQVL